LSFDQKSGAELPGALTAAEVKDLFFAFASATSTDELWSLLQTFCERWGLLHARVSIYQKDVSIEPASFLHVRSYPLTPHPGQSKPWSEHYIDEALYDHDRSFHLIFEHQVTHMLWTVMEQLVWGHSEAKRVFTEMREFAIGEGVLVGLCCGITKKTVLLGLAGPSRSFQAFHQELWVQLVRCLEVFLIHYNELAKSEGFYDSVKEECLVRFSGRQLEVIKLMSSTSEDLRTNAQIARKMGISEEGVKDHLYMIRQRFKEAGLPVYAREAIVSYCLKNRLIM